MCMHMHVIYIYICDTKGGRGRIFTDLVKFETVSRSSLREVWDWILFETCLKSLTYFEIVETVSRSSLRQVSDIQVTRVTE